MKDEMKKKKRIAIKVHPGEYLRDELKARGWTQKYLSELTGMYGAYLCDIVNGKRDISAKTAVLLERALGPSAEFWMRLQNDYDIKKAIAMLDKKD